MIGLICDWCGAAFERKQKGRFCTPSCYREWQRQHNDAKRRERLARAARVTEKACKCCGATKPRNEFHRATGNKDGLASDCKACRQWKSGAVLRGTYGRCGVPTAIGRGPCRNEAGPEGVCAIHAGHGNRWNRTKLDRHHLVNEVAELAGLGFGQGAISEALGVGRTLVWSCLLDAGMSSNGGRSDERARSEAKKLIQAKRDTERQAREAWKVKARSLVARGGRLPWHVPKHNGHHHTDIQKTELKELIEEQGIDQRRRMIYRPPHWLDLDAPLGEDDSDSYDLIWDAGSGVDDPQTPSDFYANLMASNGVDAAASRAKRHRRLNWPDRMAA